MGSLSVYRSDAGREEIPASRFPLSRDLRVDRIEGGVVPPAERADIPSTDRSRRYAGVYLPDGTLNDLSVTRLKNGKPKEPVYDSERVRAATKTRSSVEAAYCGRLHSHYGHFLLESTARLWWVLQEGFGGPLVFQTRDPGILELPFIAEFFDLVGIRDRVVIADRWMQFDSIRIPELSHMLGSYITPEFLLPFRKAAEEARGRSAGDGGSGKLYISRTRYNKADDAGRIFGEEIIERMFEREGYQVVHPQELSIGEQAVVFAGAKQVAGFIGSAMHNLVFSPENIETTYLCRLNKFPDSYQMIDLLLGNRGAAFITRYPERAGRIGKEEPFLFDVEDLVRLLREKGLFSKDNQPVFSKENLQREFESARRLLARRPKSKSMLQRLRLLIGRIMRNFGGGSR